MIEILGKNITTVDEYLVRLRGRCPFRMYIPNSTKKYTLKLVMVTYFSIKYISGRNMLTVNEPSATYFLKKAISAVGRIEPKYNQG